MRLVLGIALGAPDDLSPGGVVELQAHAGEEPLELAGGVGAEVLVADDVEPVGPVGHVGQHPVEHRPERRHLGDPVLGFDQGLHLGPPRFEVVGHEGGLVEEVPEVGAVAELAVAGDHGCRVADEDGHLTVELFGDPRRGQRGVGVVEQRTLAAQGPHGESRGVLGHLGQVEPRVVLAQFGEVAVAEPERVVQRRPESVAVVPVDVEVADRNGGVEDPRRPARRTLGVEGLVQVDEPAGGPQHLRHPAGARPGHAGHVDRAPAPDGGQFDRLLRPGVEIGLAQSAQRTGSFGRVGRGVTGANGAPSPSSGSVLSSGRASPCTRSSGQPLLRT